MSQSQPVERGIGKQPTATVNHTSDGEVLGVALFLGESDLEELGVNDADQVAYSIENGELRLNGVTTR